MERRSLRAAFGGRHRGRARGRSEPSAPGEKSVNVGSRSSILKKVLASFRYDARSPSNQFRAAIQTQLPKKGSVALSKLRTNFRARSPALYLAIVVKVIRTTSSSKCAQRYAVARRLRPLGSAPAAGSQSFDSGIRPWLSPSLSPWL